RKDKGTPFPPSALANENEVRGFRPDNGPCCDVATFRLDLTSTPGAPWNASAIKVFVDDFLACNRYDCKSRTKINRMFQSHFRTLQRHLKATSANADASGAAGSSKGKGTGRGQGTRNAFNAKEVLFHRRHEIARRYRATLRHVWILERLGIDGMSSDEEDTAAPFKRFRILVKPWRHARVTTFLRTLDALYRLWRATSSQAEKRGSQPRLRYISDKRSTSHAVSRLPANAYDDVWYGEQSSVEQDNLRAREEPYDFGHDPAIVKYVVCLCRLTYAHRQG
ncbi:hypothetical protein C8T65DRAFT_588268, partial [Cerioporus squamosus]